VYKGDKVSGVDNNDTIFIPFALNHPCCSSGF
jgi:hypothetical protein